MRHGVGARHEEPSSSVTCVTWLVCNGGTEMLKDIAVLHPQNEQARPVHGVLRCHIVQHGVGVQAECDANRA